jgi:hypothetical protein
VVVGFAGCTVVSSDVVEVVVVWGWSEAQPDKAPMTEAMMQESKSFFINLILFRAGGALAYASAPMRPS